MLSLDAVELDLDQLAARILRPDRPKLAEARAAVAGITDPREAWEALATRGVIPMDWIADHRRRYARSRPAAEPEAATIVDTVCRETPRGLARYRVRLPSAGPVGSACSPGLLAVRAFRERGLLPAEATESPPHLDLALIGWAQRLAPPGAPRVAWHALATLLATGYALDAMTDRAVVLVAPEVGDDE